jgi:hypothetical protein
VEGALYEPVYIGSKKDLISLDILSGIWNEKKTWIFSEDEKPPNAACGRFKLT